MAKTISAILVPTDYSTCTGEAIGWAVSLAAPLSADLLLLHVIRNEIADEWLSIPGMSWETMMQREKKALLELYRTWVPEEESAALLRETVVTVGDPAKKIVTTALEKHIDLIVIPTYGRREPPVENGESVSEQVVRMAACPVMTIQAACCDEPCL
jgi:nucleotide-binding universal stress UspA family protein